ncbi:MAG: 5-formyltetrahydrofolate cyclo-ligase [Candidatus Baldrarchaeia archaeon]
MTKDEKQKIREYIWNKMEKEGIARFPLPCKGRIPNFIGAEKAAENLGRMDIWKKADVVKVNPDSPQRKVRELALREGKVLIMPTPRLKQGFLILKNIKNAAREASTIRGAFKYGKKVKLEELPSIDLIVVGSVAVDLNGGRIGKSKGYSDLEVAILRELDLINRNTPIITTVHPIQIVEKVPMLETDVPVDFIVTPTEVIRTRGKYKKPSKILWELLDQEKLKEIPILQELYARRSRMQTKKP